MSKDKFVTGNLHRISDKIAEVAKKHEQELSQWKKSPEHSSAEQSSPEKEVETPPPSPPPSHPQEEIKEHLFHTLPQEEKEENKLIQKEDDLLAVARSAEEKGEKRKRLSDSVEAALQRHHEEGLRLRRDLQMLLESTAAEVTERKNAMENTLEKLKELENLLQEQRKEFTLLSFPDQDSQEYQMSLAALYRKMDKLKIDLLHLKAKSDHILSFYGNTGKEEQGTKSSINLFAEMHSLKKQELYKTGFWMYLPVITGILLAAIILAVAQILTFRVGL